MSMIDPNGPAPAPVVDPAAPPVVEDALVVPAAPKTEEPPAPKPAPAKTFTVEDIEKARQEEKDKLYKSLEETRAELAQMRQEREAREKAAADAQAAAEEAARKAAEEEMSAKDLIAQKEAEWNQRFASMQADQERNAALLEQERRFSQLQSYIARRAAEEADSILPELLDEITGSTEEEVENTINRMKAKSEAILANVVQAQRSQRQGMRGAPVTAPPVGPMDNNTEYETVTADDLRNMDMATYAKNRDRLLGAAGARVQNKGLYGS